MVALSHKHLRVCCWRVP